ncbi:MAG: O-antigen ligase family protein [Planctomycetes bacterium]|nr:O-antigen ligase family protein [Planctomycetota bacterium]
MFHRLIILSTTRLIEAGWLISLIIVPVFFNQYSNRVFEADKIYLLRSITLLMLLSYFIRALATPKDPALLARRAGLVGAFGLIYLISSFLSIAPYYAFWGYYLREEGLYTLASYLIIFYLVMADLRKSEQIERLITIVILAGLAVSIYGIFQHFNVDVVGWASGVKERVTTTLGGPIFAGAYLMMVIPLALYRLIHAVRQNDIPNSIIYTVVTIALTMCLLFTQSRGPFIGLIVGLSFFTILYAVTQKIRWLLGSTIAVAILTVVFFILLNIPKSPLASIKSHFGRLGDVVETQSGSGKVRLLIWQGAVDILKDKPLRLFFGYGLESLFPLYHRHTPSEFARFEGPVVIPDHSHNDTFDVLITGGIFGLLAYLAIIAMAVYYGFRYAGIIRPANTFILYSIAGLLAGIFLPILISGELTFLGIGIPFGLITSWGIYLVTTSKNQLSTANAKWGLLSIALCSAVLAHFAELQFGIGVTSTRLLFWVFTALITVLACRPVPTAQTDKPITKTAEPADRSVSSLSLYALLGGLIISLFIFELLKKKHILTGQVPTPFYYILAGIWLFVGVVVILRYRFQSFAHYFNYYLLYLGISGFCGLVFYLLHTNILTGQTSLPSLLNLVYIWVALLLAVLAGLIPAEKPLNLKPRVLPVITLLLSIPVYLIFIYQTNLKEAYADMFCREGDNFEKANRYDEALSSYQRAVTISPQTDYYYAALARTYKAKGDYQNAVKTLAETRTVNPLNPFHISNLGKFHTEWANTIKDNPVQRNERFDTALKYYQELARVTPLNPQVYRDTADVYIQKGDYQNAIVQYLYALKLDSQLGEIYYQLGNAYRQTNQMAEMIEAYEKAFQLNIKPARNQLSKLGEEYFNAEQYQESIRINYALLRMEPKNYQHHHNLSMKNSTRWMKPSNTVVRPWNWRRRTRRQR